MADLAGKWNMVVHTYMGDQFSEHEYIVEGDALKGVITDKSNGNKAEIMNGKVNRNQFSYKFTIKIPIGEMEFTMIGELSEEGTTKGTSSNAMGSFEFDGTRA